MFFRSIYFKEQLSVASSVGRENILALTIRIGMCVFLFSNKSKISFVFPSKCPVYKNKSNIMIDVIMLSIAYLVYLLHLLIEGLRLALNIVSLG